MKYDKYNTPWRLVANTVFGPPKSGKLYGTMDIDVTETDKYIASERKAKRKITMTSVVIAAVAHTLAEDTPEINCFIRRGRMIPRDYIDVATAVLLKGGEAMSTVIIKDAHKSLFWKSQWICERKHWMLAKAMKMKQWTVNMPSRKYLGHFVNGSIY